MVEWTPEALGGTGSGDKLLGIIGSFRSFDSLQGHSKTNFSTGQFPSFCLGLLRSLSLKCFLSLYVLVQASFVQGSWHCSKKTGLLLCRTLRAALKSFTREQPAPACFKLASSCLLCKIQSNRGRISFQDFKPSMTIPLNARPLRVA